MFDYFYYDPLSGCVIFAGSRHVYSKKAASLQAWLKEESLRYGSSLEGRRACIRAIVGRRKYRPLLLAQMPLLLFVPTGPLEDDSTCWLRYDAIASVRYGTKKAAVYFYDGCIAEVDHPGRLKHALALAKTCAQTLEASSSQLSQSSQ